MVLPVESGAQSTRVDTHRWDRASGVLVVRASFSTLLLTATLRPTTVARSRERSDWPTKRLPPRSSKQLSLPWLSS
jgi:hypothetical protein